MAHGLHRYLIVIAQTNRETAILTRALRAALTQNPLRGSCGMPTDSMLEKVDPGMADTDMYDLAAYADTAIREVRTLVANRAA